MNEHIENTAEHHRRSNHPDGQLRVEYVIPSVEEYRGLRRVALRR
ncbi:hypothetical protein ACWHAM_21670 [Paenibacillus terrae]